MATELRLRRGTTDEHGNFIGAEAEATVDTDKNTIVVHDGQTQGGFPLSREDSTDVSVDSVATLRTSSFPANLERLYLSGYYGQGTPGGGELYYDSADTTTADNGSTVFVDSDGKRWKRATNGTISLFEAGGKADGDLGFDNLDVFASLLDVAAVEDLVIEGREGDFYFSGEISFSGAKHFNANGAVFFVDGAGSGLNVIEPGARINRLTVDKKGKGLDGLTVRADNARMAECEANNCGRAGFLALGSDSNDRISGVMFENCHVDGAMLDQEAVYAGIRFQFADKSTALSCTVKNANGKGFATAFADGSSSLDCIVDGTTSPAGDGFYFGEGSKNCTHVRPVARNTDGNAAKFSRGSLNCHIFEPNFDKNRTVDNAGVGVYMQGVIDCRVTGGRIRVDATNAVIIEPHPGDGSTAASPSVNSSVVGTKIEFVNPDPNKLNIIEIRCRDDVDQSVQGSLIDRVNFSKAEGANACVYVSGQKDNINDRFVEGFTVRNCTGGEGAGQGVSVRRRANDKWSIKSNVFPRLAGSNIAEGTDAGIGVQASNVEDGSICDNQVYYQATDRSSLFVILSDGDNVAVSDNRCGGSDNFAIRLAGENYTCNGNQIDNGSDGGIQIDGAAAATGNVVKTTGTAYIFDAAVESAANAAI